MAGSCVLPIRFLSQICLKTATFECCSCVSATTATSWPKNKRCSAGVGTSYQLLYKSSLWSLSFQVVSQLAVAYRSSHSKLWCSTMTSLKVPNIIWVNWPFWGAHFRGQDMLYWQNRQLQQSLLSMISKRQTLRSLSDYYINEDHAASIFLSGFLGYEDMAVVAVLSPKV